MERFSVGFRDRIIIWLKKTAKEKEPVKNGLKFQSLKLKKLKDYYLIKFKFLIW